MKKIIAILTAALIGTVLLAGCSGNASKSSFEMMAIDNMITITVENAEEGKSADTEFVMENASPVVFDANELTEGKLMVTFKDAEGQTVAEASVSAKNVSTFNVPAGTYTVVVSVVETANGSAKVIAENK